MNRLILCSCLIVVGMFWAVHTQAQPVTPSSKPLSTQQATQMPVPRMRPGWFYAGPLQGADVDLYRRIFVLQEQGQMAHADKLIRQLKDLRLRPYVLYQRYMHPTAYRSSFTELQNWLALYADYPGASRIYRLASRRKPGGSGADTYLREAEEGKKIARRREPTMVTPKSYISPKKRGRTTRAQVANLKKKLSSLIHRDRITQALNIIHSKEARILDTVERDQVLARIAEGYVSWGKSQKAYDLARVSADRSGVQAPLAGWVAGLMAWELGRYEEAARYFSIPARSSYISGWMSSAGAYWTARSYMRLGNAQQVSHWLKKAMEHPRTFYGLIATRALGRDFDFNWDLPPFGRDDHSALQNVPAARRAMELARIGQTVFAEAELLRLNVQDQLEQAALLAYAVHARLPGLSMRLGSAIPAGEDRFYDAALYPLAPWQPRSGYQVDPALIHALIRQESRFDPLAESKSGATGLMQLMPATARYVADRVGLPYDEDGNVFSDPSFNLELGQRYLESLLKNKVVQGDLLSLLIAYNAGPGNLSRWKKNQGRVRDPLLFMEKIPVSETRIYVERVLANYWIYQMRAGQETISLDALVSGQWPRLFSG